MIPFEDQEMFADIKAVAEQEEEEKQEQTETEQKETKTEQEEKKEEDIDSNYIDTIDNLDRLHITDVSSLSSSNLNLVSEIKTRLEEERKRFKEREAFLLSEIRRLTPTKTISKDPPTPPDHILKLVRK